jgi:hypothetical protein
MAASERASSYSSSSSSSPFNAAFAAILGTDGGLSRGLWGRRHADGRSQRWRYLGLRPFVVRLQVDDVAQSQVHAHGIVRALRRLGTRLRDRRKDGRYRTAAGIVIRSW